MRLGAAKLMPTSSTSGARRRAISARKSRWQSTRYLSPPSACTRTTPGTAASRWLPVIGAAAVAGYAYYDTLQVAKTAIGLLETPELAIPA